MSSGLSLFRFKWGGSIAENTVKRPRFSAMPSLFSTGTALLAKRGSAIKRRVKERPRRTPAAARRALKGRKDKSETQAAPVRERSAAIRSAARASARRAPRNIRAWVKSLLVRAAGGRASAARASDAREPAARSLSGRVPPPRFASGWAAGTRPTPARSRRLASARPATARSSRPAGARPTPARGRRRQLDGKYRRMAAAAVFVLLIIFLFRLIDTGVKIKTDAEIVAAFRAPYRAIGPLRDYASRHGEVFAEVFTLFCAENAFFPEKDAAYDLSGLERQYVENFELLKRKYSARSAAPYIEMFQSLFADIQSFPIPRGFDEGGEPSYMYGDSWGMELNYENDKTHRGADIYDRENIKGRIPIASMTGGTVRESGWDGRYGYFVNVSANSGNQYVYAHLDSISADIITGMPVFPGQVLGRMGNSGPGQENGAFPVHLHLGVMLEKNILQNDFWVNPYPLLRYMEETPYVS